MIASERLNGELRHRLPLTRGWYDNSVNNKFNPDPTHDVFSGEQTWEEMMTGYIGVLVSDPHLDPRQLFEKSVPATQASR
jgi:hypothetical protein